MREAATLPVPPEVGRVRWSPGKSAWLWLQIGGGGAALTWGLPGPGVTAAAVALTVATLCLGHSVGLHRGLIHRSFRMGRRTRQVLVSLFVLTGLGGPLSWIRLHRVRDHWQNQRECPPYFAYRHGLLRDFAWNLHCRFVPLSWGRYALDRSLERDGYLRFLERTWWMWNVLFSVLLVPWTGWRAAMVLGPGRVAGSMLGHWFIGYWTHKHGARRYHIAGASEEGSNSLVLGWISFGEGFHNNHHALPDSARMGVGRGEFDLGWIAVLALERVGLVHAVRSWSRGNADVRTRAPEPPSLSRCPAERRSWARAWSDQSARTALRRTSISRREVMHAPRSRRRPSATS